MDELAYGPDDMWDQTCRGTSWVHTPVTHGLSAYGSGASCLDFVVRCGEERDRTVWGLAFLDFRDFPCTLSNVEMRMVTRQLPPSRAVLLPFPNSSCLIPKIFYKKFHIYGHIKFCGTCMKH